MRGGKAWTPSAQTASGALSAATQQIVGHERSMREQAEKKDMLQLQDSLLRSWGELMYARLMDVKEFMKRYSDIR